jgi:DNA-binding transcriptional ArsR family regulator
MIKATPIKFKNLPLEMKTRLNRLNGSTRKFVKDVYKDEVLLYWKAAKGVGLVIYSELKFEKGFEKGSMVNLFYNVSNKMLEEKYGISRQSKYRAIKKLKEAGLIEYRVDAGKNIQCRILTK